MKPLLVALALSTLALAGCTSDDGDAAVGGDGSGAGADASEVFQLHMPEWQVGDWWTYSNSYGSDFTLVVSEDGGTTWTMDTDQADLAFVHSLTEISFLGDIRKSDLAGSQGSDDVQWLDFPLQNNKEWSTTWDGHDFDLVSHVDEATQVAHITASIDDTIVNQMVYDGDVGWFTKMVFGDPATGEEMGTLELKESGSGFTGELIRVDSNLVMQGDYSGPLSDAATFDPSASDDADAYLMLTSSCSTGYYTFAIGTAQALTNSVADTGEFEDQGHTVSTVCSPDGYDFAGVIGLDPDNGDQWGYAINSESADLELSYQLFIRDFERITL